MSMCSEHNEILGGVLQWACLPCRKIWGRSEDGQKMTFLSARRSGRREGPVPTEGFFDILQMGPNYFHPFVHSWQAPMKGFRAISILREFTMIFHAIKPKHTPRTATRHD